MVFIKNFDESSRPGWVRKLQNDAQKIIAPQFPRAISLSKFLFRQRKFESSLQPFTLLRTAQLSARPQIYHPDLGTGILPPPGWPGREVVPE
jgi:hypothetical protein